MNWDAIAENARADAEDIVKALEHWLRANMTMVASLEDAEKAIGSARAVLVEEIRLALLERDNQRDK